MLVSMGLAVPVGCQQRHMLKRRASFYNHGMLYGTLYGTLEETVAKLYSAPPPHQRVNNHIIIISLCILRSSVVTTLTS